MRVRRSVRERGRIWECGPHDCSPDAKIPAPSWRICDDGGHFRRSCDQRRRRGGPVGGRPSQGKQPLPIRRAQADQSAIGSADLPCSRGYVSLIVRNHATMKYWAGSAGLQRFDNVGFDGPVVDGWREHSVPD